MTRYRLRHARALELIGPGARHMLANEQRSIELERDEMACVG